MKVLKFGGTSVGSAQRMKDVAQLICNGQQKIVVLSAMSGTTNSLIEISDYLFKKNSYGAMELINALEQKYLLICDELFATEPSRAKGKDYIKEAFESMRSISKAIFTTFEEKCIIAQGELISTKLFTLYLEEQGVKACLLPALDYMRIDKNGEPDMAYIADNLKALLENNPQYDIYITQGFICKNCYGETDILQRGGSDYTAAIIGVAINSEEIQIWTDNEGMRNNDPQWVDNTQPVHFLHFEEAAELAYFGTKILHPTCILPAKLHNIPVRVLNTMDPTAHGTLITNNIKPKKVEAVAAKDGIASIKIKSGRMLMAHGFLRKVLETFETHKTSIDMVTTSEVGVSVTIDNLRHLDDIVDDLKKFGTVTVEKDMGMICVVGDLPYEHVGFQAQVLNALQDISLRMISYGGSNYNISFLVKAEDKARALQSLSKHLF